MTRDGRKRIELRAAVVLAAVAGGCGSGDERAVPPPLRLPGALATRLASRSDDVARLLERNDSCGALAAAHRLQREAIAAINARQVPPRLQEPLLGAANDLAARIHCVPPPQPAPKEEDEGRNHDRGRGKDHGKGHGKGKHGHDGGQD